MTRGAIAIETKGRAGPLMDGCDDERPAMGLDVDAITILKPNSQGANVSDDIVENVTTRHLPETGCNHEPASSRVVAAPSSAVRVRTRSRQHWSEHEQNCLHVFWAVKTIAQIADDLNRSPAAIYRQAAKVGLRARAPQGWETITRAAHRAGLSIPALRVALRNAHVNVRDAVTFEGTKRRTHIVESHDVDLAVAQWCRGETIAHAARRLGFSTQAVRARVLAAIARGELPSRGRRRSMWRLDPSVYERLLAPLMTRESAMAAARRHGISADTMKKWMRAAGCAPATHRSWLLDPDAVDAVIAEKRTASTRAFRTKKTEEATS